MWLVVGLGNPGSEYSQTRHNVGFMTLDALSARASTGPMRSKFGAALAEGKLGDERVLLCKPMEFMNASGEAVGRVAGFWKIPVERTVVVHDDLDLPVGRLKLAAGGGHGGHNGIRSMIACLGGAEFARVRVGIGRPPAGRDAADYVLSGFSRAEQKELALVLEEAAAAVETVVRQGLTPAMNKFNVRNVKKRENTGTS
jgi:PTH1 family peptidyl-tRNA hydrolase